MNKTKIEWVKGPNGEPGYTWNPVTGCLHGCPYCYAKRITQRFGGPFKAPEKIITLDEPVFTNPPDAEDKQKFSYPYGFKPTFHRYRLDEPKRLKKPSKIFTVSMGDLFGDWVPDEWIKAILKTVRECPQHQFLFLTKNYSAYYKWLGEFPDNCWIGATADNATAAHCISDTFNSFAGLKTFISLEPLLEDVAGYMDLYTFDWIIVGAQTGPGAKPPKPEWVQSIIDQARAAEVPIFLKDNLHWPEKIQEWPEGLK